MKNNDLDKESIQEKIKMVMKLTPYVEESYKLIIRFLARLLLGINFEQYHFQKFSNIGFPGTRLLEFRNIIKNPSNFASLLKRSTYIKKRIMVLTHRTYFDKKHSIFSCMHYGISQHEL